MTRRRAKNSRIQEFWGQYHQFGRSDAVAGGEGIAALQPHVRQPPRLRP